MRPHSAQRMSGSRCVRRVGFGWRRCWAARLLAPVSGVSDPLVLGIFGVRCPATCERCGTRSGGDYCNTFVSRSHLASWLGTAGLTDEAIGAHEKLLNDQTRGLGPDHPDTIATDTRLAALREERRRGGPGA